jgi:hypothetical protein
MLIQRMFRGTSPVNATGGPEVVFVVVAPVDVVGVVVVPTAVLSVVAV